MLDLLASVLPWLVVGVCIVSEAFFAAAELSIVSADPIRLAEAAAGGRAAARRVQWFRSHPDRLFGTTLLGTNISMVTGSTVASLTLASLTPDHGEWLAMLIMSPLVLIAGEVVPKGVAQARANQLAELLAGPLLVVHRLLTPLVLLVRAYTSFLYRALGISGASAHSAVSREELVLVMDSEVTRGGDIDPDEREMISRIFAFSDMEARDTMVPLVEMVAVPATATVREAAEVIAREGFSRLPVYGERVDDVVGILHHLDLLAAEAATQTVAALMRPPFFVPERQQVDDILILLQREAASAAIVVDEFGGAVGLITLEDILEEIVGDIVDEYDDAGHLWRRADGGWIISARAPVDQINQAFGLELDESPDYETLAGFMLSTLRVIPPVGETLPLPGGARLVVRRASARAIQEVLLTGVRGPRGPR
ncbi:MAG: HlyC/CorC family transporter [Myxococcales bacterium]|nr:HlyC/CorC family transporter [Myxococcales bacterium]